MERLAAPQRVSEPLSIQHLYSPSLIIDRVDEEFLLFALHRDGTWDRSAGGSVKYGVAGAWLAELVLEGRIRLEGGYVLPKGRYPVHDPSLEAMYAPIRDSGRPRPITHWVHHGARRAAPGIAQVMKRLVERGYVEAVPARSWGRKVTRYPQHTPGGRSEMRAFLVDHLFGRREPDETTLALLAVLDAAGFSAHAFGKAHKDDVHERVKRLLARDARFVQLADAIWSCQGWRFLWSPPPVASAHELADLRRNRRH